jgi:hypothetical protein
MSSKQSPTGQQTKEQQAPDRSNFVCTRLNELGTRLILEASFFGHKRSKHERVTYFT